MNKIAKKLILPITMVIVVISLLAVLSNVLLTGYLAIKKEEKQLDKVYAELQTQNPKDLKLLEETYNVAIFDFENQEEPNAFNERFRDTLTEKNIGYTKLWLWDEDFWKLKERGAITKLYHQGWLNYSILVKYVFDQGQICAIVMNVPDTTQTLTLINCSNVIVILTGGAIIAMLVFLLIRRMTKPLSELSEAAKKVGTPAFKPIKIESKDEIADLAQDFNRMSERLLKAQHQLEAKNKAMQALLAGVAHEIKTPAALIKAYASGIRDGIDDGSFLETIDEQSTIISQMTEELIDLSDLERQAPSEEYFDLSELTQKTIKRTKMLIQERCIKSSHKIEPEIFVKADVEETLGVLQNFITNAAKYGNTFMRVTLENEGKKALLKVTNDIDNPDLEVERIWDPFYVGEASRSKHLSGTGLGLAVVRAHLNRAGLNHGCQYTGHEICFFVYWDLEN